MPEEEKNKDEKSKYLKRDEVRTMEKDITKLRESESEKARGRIAEIKTEEELVREKAGMEQAQRTAEERERVETEAQQKEEELKRLRRESALKEGELRSEESKRAEEEKERLRAQFREAQLKEEAERRKFLENISRQAGDDEPTMMPPLMPTERPVPPPIPPPIAPPLPAEAPAGAKEGKKPFKFPFPSIKIPKPKIPAVQLPKVQLPKVTGYFPGKPSIFAKIWIRIVASLFVLAILATIATFWYWYLVVRPAPAPPKTPAPPAEEPKPIQTQPKPAEPFINEKILQFGYHIPSEPRTIDTIIIHSIYTVYSALSGDPHSIEGVIEEYETYGVAAHYLIARDGKIFQTAPREAIAYHAGDSQMPNGRTNVNNFSIGIELIYTKEETPAETQYQSLTQLVKYLQKEYGIPTQNILGHKDIAPDRKDDPWNFDWSFLGL